MTTYIYPACFHYEDDGGFSIFFPDFPCGGSCGDDLAQAMYMARDFLYAVIDSYQEDGKPLPTPTDMRNVVPDPEYGEAFVSLIYLEYESYKEYVDNFLSKEQDQDERQIAVDTVAV